MPVFDDVVSELATKLNIGSKAAPVLGEILQFITAGPGAIAGFLDRMKIAGLSPEVSKWVGGTGDKPLPVAYVEQILNGDTLMGMASRIGLSPAAVTASAGIAIPKLVAGLTPGGTVPTGVPPEVTAFLASLKASAITPPPITPTPVTPTPAPTPSATPPSAMGAAGTAAAASALGAAASVRPGTLSAAGSSPPTATPASPVTTSAAAAVTPVGKPPSVGDGIGPANGPVTTPIAPSVAPASGSPPPPLKASAAASPPAPPPQPAVSAAPLIPEPAERRSRGMSWMLPLLVLLAVGALGLIGQMWRGSTPEPMTGSAPTTAAAPQAGTASSTVSAPSASPPTTAAATTGASQSHLLLTNNNGDVSVAGVVKDDATRSLILDAFKSAFGANKVHGDLNVNPDVAPATWASKIGDMLGNFKVNGLQALLDGSSINVGGLIPDMDRDKIVAALRSLFGSSATVGNLSDNTALLAADTNAQATATLSNLKSGYSAKDVVTVLNATIINFATGSADVPQDSRGLLKIAADKLKGVPSGTMIEVAGFTDNTGDDAANLTLSQQRAEAVKALLVQEGVDQAALTAKGYGSASPVASNDTDAGRLRNRRIEYHLSGS
jgi:OmpA-OmpF porin, OOP family